MEAETLPDSTTTAAVVHFAATDGGGPAGTQSATTTIGMDVDAAFPDLFLSNEQVRLRSRRSGEEAQRIILKIILDDTLDIKKQITRGKKFTQD